MNTLNKIISYTSLGAASLLVGCDENRNVDLARGKIKDIKDAEIRIIKNIRSEKLDIYTIEIYDSSGNIKGRLEFSSLPSGYIQYEDKLVSIRSDGVLTEDKSSYKVEKQE